MAASFLQSRAREPVVEVDRVSTRFGETVVHENISLSVYRGELFAIIGGSGSGKTTLLREMILLREPDAGSIRLFGEETRAMGPAGLLRFRRRSGVLFQEGGLFSALTVAENAAVPLKEHTALSGPLVREIALIKIGLTGLAPESAVKYPSELSSGMRRRAGLARAIALDPELLFLDEPTAGLDPISAAGLDALIERLKTRLGLTIVMVTHDLDALWRLADRVAVLGEGRIVAVGTMAELARSKEPLVRAFFQGGHGREVREPTWKQR
jgi:phospholipid/cholesterol/gamma-HCH transport system ATP-binding protein